jgi:hypothetical protein
MDSSTAFEELENYSDRLQVDLQNLISPDDCIRDLLDDKSTYTALNYTANYKLRTVYPHTPKVILEINAAYHQIRTIQWKY